MGIKISPKICTIISGALPIFLCSHRVEVFGEAHEQKLAELYRKAARVVICLSTESNGVASPHPIEFFAFHAGLIRGKPPTVC